MKNRLPSKRKVVQYTAISLGLGLAAGFYFSDRTPPELLSFNLSSENVRVLDPAPQLEFTGRITDERGVTGAEMQCLQDGDIKLLIYIAMAGGDRNRVSFGEVSGSFGWAGRWSGTSYDLSFEGLGKLPQDIEAGSCDWYAKLSDIVGNESFIDTGVSLRIDN